MSQSSINPPVRQDPTSLSSEGFLEFVQEHFVLSDFRRINSHLSRNGYLLPGLIRSYRAILNIFGEGVKITLTLLNEPDYCNEPELFCLIRTHLPYNEALSKFNDFDSCFAGPLSKEFGLKINFDLDL